MRTLLFGLCCVLGGLLQNCSNNDGRGTVDDGATGSTPGESGAIGTSTSARSQKQAEGSGGATNAHISARVTDSMATCATSDCSALVGASVGGKSSAATGATGLGGTNTPRQSNTGGLSRASSDTGMGGASLEKSSTNNGGTIVGSTDRGGASTAGGRATLGNGGSGATSALTTHSPTGGSSSAAFSICSGTPASRRPVSIYVVGDSTASVYASDLYPRMGWGQVLGDYFASACAVVKDKALSGRSSKSYLDEGNWTPVRDGLASGDFVIIQFGHNDEKSEDAARYTDPQTTFKQYLTKYVNETRAKNAFPVLATPIQRNKWNGGTLSDTHGAYPPAMRELAQELDVPLVDMTELTKAYFEKIGQAETTKLFLVLAAGESPNYPEGSTDNTHLQEKGARVVAQLFTSDAYEQKQPLAANLKAIPGL